MLKSAGPVKGNAQTCRIDTSFLRAHEENDCIAMQCSSNIVAACVYSEGMGSQTC